MVEFNEFIKYALVAEIVRNGIFDRLDNSNACQFPICFRIITVLHLDSYAVAICRNIRCGRKFAAIPYSRRIPTRYKLTVKLCSAACICAPRPNTVVCGNRSYELEIHFYNRTCLQVLLKPENRIQVVHIRRAKLCVATRRIGYDLLATMVEFNKLVKLVTCRKIVFQTFFFYRRFFFIDRIQGVISCRFYNRTCRYKFTTAVSIQRPTLEFVPCLFRCASKRTVCTAVGNFLRCKRGVVGNCNGRIFGIEYTNTRNLEIRICFAVHNELHSNACTVLRNFR